MDIKEIEKAILEINQLESELVGLKETVAAHENRIFELSADVIKHAGLRQPPDTKGSKNKLTRQPEYAALPVTEAIQRILQGTKEALSVFDITSQVYVVTKDKDYRDASRRITALLARIKKKGDIETVSRGVYRSTTERPGDTHRLTSGIR